MKTIMVMFDSLNRRMLPPYGSKDVHAPNFSKLAEKTATFDCSYVGSMPCMPARRELHTGRINFLHRSWGPVEPFDDSMPEILNRHGIHSHLVSDHYHYWEDGGCTYHGRYTTWDIIRGQEEDKWIPLAHPDDPPEHLGQLRRHYNVNRHFIDSEEKQPQNITFDHALDFLEMNRDKDDWFLQVETFDPHEPYHVLEEYAKLYPGDFDGPFFNWPKYGEVKESEAAVAHLRRQYMALLSMCDHNLGRILQYMDARDMWKDTMLIVNTDHGYLLCEHDWWGKCVMPFYDEIARTPLFVWDPRLPEAKNVRRSSLVQTIDICPTVLDFFGIEIPRDVEGKPLGPVLERDAPIHDGVLFGQHGSQVNVTDGRYVYMRSCQTKDNKPLYQYTLMPTHISYFFEPEELRTAELVNPFSFTKGLKVLKTESTGFMGAGTMGSAAKDPSGNTVCDLPSEALKRGGKRAEIFHTRLYDTLSDPEQVNPMDDPAQEARMTGLLIKKMRENDAPQEQFVRLGLA